MFYRISAFMRNIYHLKRPVSNRNYGDFWDNIVKEIKKGAGKCGNFKKPNFKSYKI
jgi:hypothetical protein